MPTVEQAAPHRHENDQAVRASAPDKLVGKDAGFHHHFGKPVVLHELLEALSGVKPQR